MMRITLNDSRDFLDWRLGSGETIEIFDIVVGSERGVGRGRMLINKLLRVIPKSHLVFAIARESNGIAKDFYLAMRFKIVARLPDFYEEESAIMYGLKVPK